MSANTTEDIRLHRRRKKTARELAERFDISTRTVRRLIAENRWEYEARAQEIRSQIIDLKRQGMKQVEIAQKLGVTKGLVSIRLKEARLAGVDLTPTISALDNAQKTA